MAARSLWWNLGTISMMAASEKAFLQVLFRDAVYLIELHQTNLPPYLHHSSKTQSSVSPRLHYILS